MLNWNQVQISYLYDVYWFAWWLLFTGSKYLEYISSIRIMHNDIINGNNCLQNIWTNISEWEQNLGMNGMMPMWLQIVNSQYRHFNTRTTHWTDTLSNEYSREIRGLLCAQGTHCTGQGGLSWLSPLRLDGSQDDQAEEAGSFIGGQESQNYKTKLPGPVARWPLKSLILSS